MVYKQIDPNAIWDALGDGEIIVGVVLDDEELLRAGVYELAYQPVNMVIEMVNQDNTIFFKKMED